MKYLFKAVRMQVRAALTGFCVCGRVVKRGSLPSGKLRLSVSYLVFYWEQLF